MATIFAPTEARYPQQLIYDPANSVHASGDTETSLTAKNPTIITAEGLDAATKLQVQVRLNNSAVWHDFKEFDGAVTPNFVLEFDPRYNFVRVTRTAGTADPLVYVQYGG